LRRATKKNSTDVVQGSEEYWYDAFGQRIAIVQRDATGAKTEMIWFIGDTEAHYDAAGKITHIYSHLSMGMPVARVDRTHDTIAVEYQFHGLANNMIAAVDKGGEINTSFSYTPFGEIMEATNSGGTTSGITAHRRLMNDKYEDSLSSLVYYGIRYLDKTLLNWTQSDPLYRFRPDSAWADPRRAALYTVNINNPLRYIDPDGHQAAAVFEGGLELAKNISAEGEWGVPIGGAVVVGTVLAAGTVYIGSELYDTISELWTHPITSDGTGCGSHCIMSEPEPEPETGSPKDITKDPYKGHPYRERPPVEKEPPPPPRYLRWPPGPDQGGAKPHGFTGDTRNPDNTWPGRGQKSQQNVAIQRKKAPFDFDIPCLSCTIYRERSRSRFDIEAAKSSKMF
jgi:RHS repeat-associated protein